MKHILFILSLLPVFAGAQTIVSLNVNYWYDPQNEVGFKLKPVRTQSSVDVYFEFTTPASYSPASYSVTWERKSSYTQRSGEILTPEISDTTVTQQMKKGKLTFPVPEKPWILLVKVKNTTTGSSWAYFTLIEPKYPVNGYLRNGDDVVLKNFADISKDYTLQGSGSGKAQRIFYYKESFPASSPPFAEKGATVDRFMFPDSSYFSSPGASVRFNKKGLYLVQEDTNSAEGFAFRVVNDPYPKYIRMDELTPPMIFLTTKDEYDQLLAAQNEKPKFDRVILDITKDKERAKNFMRSYFRRVELANSYFTSYKEGWKTDRGMIYLIFGLPDEVSRNGGNEIWYYKSLQMRFTFVKSGSVYDPDNYVLVRDKRFTEKWYSTIDLWRKSRF